MPTTIWTATRFLKCSLTDDEVKVRGQQLAAAVKEFNEEATEQKDRKAEMKEQLDEIESRIDQLARVVNEKAEQRDVVVEIRADLGLKLIEEVRTDSGEMLGSRTMSGDDLRQAQANAQMALPTA